MHCLIFITVLCRRYLLLSSVYRNTNICKRKKCIRVCVTVLISLRWPDDIVAVLCEKGGSGERHIVT